MDKKIIIGGLLAVVLVGGGYYFFNKSNLSGGTAAAVQSLSGAGKFTDILKLEGANECDVVINNAGITASGKVYLANDMARADFKGKNGEQEVINSMITKSGEMYLWMNLDNKGIRTNVPPADPSAPYAGGFNPTVDITYDCKAWTVDESLFNAPETITFEALPTTPAPTTTVNEDTTNAEEK